MDMRKKINKGGKCNFYKLWAGHAQQDRKQNTDNGQW